MAISNTSVLIKRSLTTAIPSSAKQGELAYSYSSNTLFIGTPGGNGVVNVGGQFYTSTIDNATNANVANTLVKRNVSGAFSGLLYGNSNTATTLQTARNFSISGGDISASTQSFDGSAAVVLNASLNTIAGLTAGFYGGSTASSSTIPVVQVAANGRIMSIANTTVTSSFNLTDGTNVKSFQSGNTLYVLGTTGIVSTVSQNTVTLSTDTTIARTNTSSVGAQVFQTDISLPTNNLTVGGRITVKDISISGNVVQYNATSTLNVGDPIIYLAANNVGNSVDMGFVGNFTGTGHSGGFNGYQHTGFVRDYADNKWKLFSNVIVEPTTTVTFDANTWYDTIKVGGVDLSNGNITSGAWTGNTISTTYGGTGLTSFTSGGAVYATSTSALTTGTLPIGSGGTGATTFNAGQILIGNGTGALQSLANTGTAKTYANAAYLPVITTDAYGRVSNVSNTKIAIDGSQITSGTIPVGTLYYYDGYGSYARFDSTGIYFYDNGAYQTTWGIQTISGGAQATGINFDAGAIVTGIIPIVHGGTNNNTFTNNTLTYYNGTSVVSLANVSTINTSISSNNTVNNITVDGYGRVTNYTTQAIGGLTVGQGGTGFASATANGIIYGNGTGALQVTALAGSGSDQTWSNQILTVTNAGVPVWASAMDGGTF